MVQRLKRGLLWVVISAHTWPPGPHTSLERNVETGRDAWSWMEFIIPEASLSFKVLNINFHILWKKEADAKNKTSNLKETVWGELVGEREMD